MNPERREEGIVYWSSAQQARYTYRQVRQPSVMVDDETGEEWYDDGLVVEWLTPPF